VGSLARQRVIAHLPARPVLRLLGRQSFVDGFVFGERPMELDFLGEFGGVLITPQ
jgi:hypothetical protein